MKSLDSATESLAPQAEKAGDNRINKRFKGIGVSSGVAIGEVFLLERASTKIFPHKLLDADEIEDELARFETAVQEAAHQLKKIRSSIEPGHPLEDYIYVLDTHILLLEDRMLFQGTKDAISSAGRNAEWALSEIIDRITSAFETIEDEYLKERARDVRFVGERILRILMGSSEASKIHQVPANCIIVAHDLSHADTAQIQSDRVLGFAVEMGGKTSHTAIMARSLKMPAVCGLEHVTRHVVTGDTLIIDGSTGLAIVNPDRETIFRYKERQEVFRNYHRGLMNFGRLPAVTMDGACSVRVLANMELMDEIELARSHGAEGIGLFRTEYLFLGRYDLPSEEEQYEAYRRVLEEFSPNPVTIRSLDVGADKILSNLNVDHEANPAMGMRAIRLCLGRTELFKTQLRAILRASVHGNCQLLIPMISCLTELQTTREIIEEVKQELSRQGHPFSPKIPLGILVEVPSAVTIADLLARDADFFSIGTNDLIQYSLAIDRVNEHVNYLYDTLHPAVLRLIRQVTEAGRARVLRVAMCGEMAGDPVNIPILLGMGIDELSMNALSIPMVKKLIRSIRMDECQELTARAFDMDSSQTIRNCLEGWIQDHFPQDYFVANHNQTP